MTDDKEEAFPSDYWNRLALEAIDNRVNGMRIVDASSFQLSILVADIRRLLDTARGKE